MTPKAELRREGYARRGALDPPWRETASTTIREHLLRLPEIEKARSVSVYSSIRSEVDTHGLIHALLARHKRVALPCILHKLHCLELRVVDAYPDGCRRTDFGILEPEPLRHPEVVSPAAMDVIVVPGVVFDRHGYRIGYGGGYYDKLLMDEHQAVKIGLAFGCQIVDAIPRDPWDRPVNLICTEQGIVETRLESLERYEHH